MSGLRAGYNRLVGGTWLDTLLPVIGRYVVAGGLATGVNFLSRIPLSMVFAFEVAVVIAQAIGFTIGFLLYRHFVFTRAGTTLAQQIAGFGGVNLVAAGVVICVAIVLRLVLLKAGMAPFYAEMFAHAGGLAAGAPFNFSGHFLLTFRARS